MNDRKLADAGVKNGDTLMITLSQFVLEKGYNYPHHDLECIEGVRSYEDAVAMFAEHDEADMFVYKIPGADRSHTATGPASALWLKKAGAFENRYADADCMAGFRPDRGDEKFQAHVMRLASLSK